MIKSLLKTLFSKEDVSFSDAEARLALAALLVRVARADFEYDAREVARIDQILTERYGFDLPAAQALRREAEALEAEAPDTVRFTRVIKDAVPYEERSAVIQALWSVVLADAQRDQHEDALLRMVANLLGVSDRDSHLARQRATEAPSR
ncbi:TerB family tellurite resistance protein [uncultured Lentibacter sp.]|jgi:uncharacterized tellurite resistance protein B-like protein|uniref:tellurite resistance TerB family protein n=1 Tax=uncultured Lentibacter sp. TaxID=1659309 RepID=UPI00260BBAB9|nr:TerB family tellurite resistance protein [uncultured Lentibacter sp.]